MSSSNNAETPVLDAKYVLQVLQSQDQHSFSKLILREGPLCPDCQSTALCPCRSYRLSLVPHLYKLSELLHKFRLDASASEDRVEDLKKLQNSLSEGWVEWLNDTTRNKLDKDVAKLDYWWLFTHWFLPAKDPVGQDAEVWKALDELVAECAKHRFLLLAIREEMKKELLRQEVLFDGNAYLGQY